MNPRHDRWIIPARPNPDARWRLIGFPHAGGSARMFAAWPSRLPADVEVLGVQLPGREERLSEPPFARMPPLLEALLPALRPYLDVPFVFFGHSLGALVAFEVARALYARQLPGPAQLIVSGKAGPTAPTHDLPMHSLPEAEFRARLRTLQGTPLEILDNEELMRIFLPLLRADFALSETYVFPGGPPLPCPISAYGASDDPMITRATLESWQAQTTGPFSLRLFSGGHFYLKNSDAFFAALSQELSKALGPSWCPPPEDMRLQDGEVHLWRVNLELPAQVLDRLDETLSPEERQRAAGFYFDSHRNRFRASHGLLRAILGRYLDIPPDQVAFQSGQAGKPELTLPPGRPAVHFNLSHSGSLALVGVILGRQIGVDVERLRPLPDALKLAERYFSPGERQILQNLPPEEIEKAFFRCWTRKEAFMKAQGVGLSLGLDTFEVAFAPGEPARLLWSNQGPNEPDRWWMAGLDLGADYTGACVVEGGPCQLLFWENIG